ncbi:MAG: MFS transporter [Verrucomicrobia bacterium]|nr:MFS transporter [Verrucomicrobiota bacterium]
MIAAFGDRINQTALLSIVVYTTGNTAKYSADIMFWAVAPAVALGPFAAALIDRWDRQRLMVISNVARSFLAAGLPLLMLQIKHHYAIYAVVFLMGAFATVFTPSRLALMPRLAPDRLMLPANALLSQAGTVATLAAMPVSGYIVERFGRETSFFLNGLTYLAAAAFIWTLRPLPSVAREGHGEGTGHSPLEEIRAGLRYIRNTRAVLFYVIFTGLTQCLVAVFFVCFLSYGADVVGSRVGTRVLVTNLLFGAMGVGMAAGAVWLGRFPKWSERFWWPMVMMVCTGLGMVALSQIYNPWFAAMVLLDIGFCAVMVLVPVDTFLQKNVPDEFRGRVFVVRGALVGIAFLVCLQFSKALLHQLGVLHSLECLGLAAMMVGLASVWIGQCICAAKSHPSRDRKADAVS